MPLVTAGQNACLSGGLGNVVAYLALHTGDPSTTGANEATGGSYARQAVAWNTVGSGVRTNNGAIVFPVPAGTYYHVGLWSAITTGTFYGYFPLQGATAVAPKAGNAAASTDLITAIAHGFSAGDRVLTYDIEAAGVPTGLTEGTVYFVIAAGLTADLFSVSTTSGGSAVDITANGPLAVQKCVPETFANAGTYTIPDASLTLDAKFV